MYDDLKEVKPYTKFVFQVVVTIIVILFGLKIKIIPHVYIAIPLTVFWIVGITNALNILDNMDGLSCGITLVSSICIFIYAMQNNLHLVMMFSSVLSGTTLGFLIFNFNPAKIFMGDCGSLLLGFLLSTVTILGTWQEATNLLFVLIVPLFILVIPIFDTSLVTFYRKKHGQFISEGGKDHSSHRLVFLGLSERRAVLILMGISLFFGILIVCLSSLDFFTILILFSVLFVCLLFFGIFLGGISVYADETRKSLQRKGLIHSVILYKKQVLQIIVDIIVINIAYISAYLLKFEGIMSDDSMRLIETSLPIMILVKISIFSIFGLYKSEWRYIGIHDMIKVFKGVSLSTLLCIAIIFILYRFKGYSRAVFVNDYVLTLLMVGGVRVLIRVLKEYFSGIIDESNNLPILIMGAGDGGELLLREIRNNPEICYKPIGFIDDDITKKNRMIHGLKVLGTREDIPSVTKKNGIKKVIISILSEEKTELQSIYEICNDFNVECERMKNIIEI